MTKDGSGEAAAPKCSVAHLMQLGETLSLAFAANVRERRIRSVFRRIAALKHDARVDLLRLAQTSAGVSEPAEAAHSAVETLYGRLRERLRSGSWRGRPAWLTELELAEERTLDAFQRLADGAHVSALRRVFLRYMLRMQVYHDELRRVDSSLRARSEAGLIPGGDWLGAVGA